MPLCRAGEENADDDTEVEEGATASSGVAEAVGGARGANTETGTAVAAAGVSKDDVEVATV